MNTIDQGANVTKCKNGSACAPPKRLTFIMNRQENIPDFVRRTQSGINTLARHPTFRFFMVGCHCGVSLCGVEWFSNFLRVFLNRQSLAFVRAKFWANRSILKILIFFDFLMTSSWRPFWIFPEELAILHKSGLGTRHPTWFPAKKQSPVDFLKIGFYKGLTTC